jgi:hypothetical protein
MITVPERLRELAKLYEERNAIYGDDYKRHGDIMRALFPQGLVLNNAEDFNRYGVFKELVTKLSRYAAQWNNGGHHESLNDLAVYSAMLQELDAAWRELYTIGNTYSRPSTKNNPCSATIHSNAKSPTGVRIECSECGTGWNSISSFSCGREGRDTSHITNSDKQCEAVKIGHDGISAFECTHCGVTFGDPKLWNCRKTQRKVSEQLKGKRQ